MYLVKMLKRFQMMKPSKTENIVVCYIKHRSESRFYSSCIVHSMSGLIWKNVVIQYDLVLMFLSCIHNTDINTINSRYKEGKVFLFICNDKYKVGC